MDGEAGWWNASGKNRLARVMGVGKQQHNNCMTRYKNRLPSLWLCSEWNVFLVVASHREFEEYQFDYLWVLLLIHYIIRVRHSYLYYFII